MGIYVAIIQYFVEEYLKHSPRSSGDYKGYMDFSKSIKDCIGRYRITGCGC